MVPQSTVCWACFRMCSGVWGLVPRYVWYLRALHVGHCCWVCSGFGVWFLCVSGTSEHGVLGSVLGCVQGCGVWFLCMSSTVCWALSYDVFGGLESGSWPCLSPQSAVDVGHCCRMCSGVWGVLFVAMSGTPEHGMLGMVVGCVRRVGVRFVATSGTSEQCMCVGVSCLGMCGMTSRSTVC